MVAVSRVLGGQVATQSPEEGFVECLEQFSLGVGHSGGGSWVFGVLLPGVLDYACSGRPHASLGPSGVAVVGL